MLSVVALEKGLYVNGGAYIHQGTLTEREALVLLTSSLGWHVTLTEWEDLVQLTSSLGWHV